MTKEIDIDYEDSFDESPDDDTSNDSSSQAPKPLSGGPDIDYEGKKPPDNLWKPSNKKLKEELKEKQRLQREREKALQATHREELSAVKKEFQARMRAEKNEYSKLLAQSKSNSSDVRSQAVGARVGAYSLASALGLKGYVTASIVDQFAIRPAEDNFSNQQEDYQNQLRDYQNSIQEHKAKQFEAEQRRIKERQRRELEDLQKGTAPRQPGQPPAYPDEDITPKHGIGGKWTQNKQGKWQYRVNGQFATPAQPPVQGPPIIPPNASNPIQPFQPPGGQPTPPNIGGIAAPFQILAATIETLQRINDGIEKAAKAVTSTVVSGVKGDGTSAAKGFANIGQKIIDPLGVNIPIQVAVQGFNSLLDLNEGILDSVKKNIEFSPMTLQTDVVGEIQKLSFQIKSSMELDPITSRLVEANTQFELAWMEFRNDIIRRFAPEIIGFLKIITPLVKQMALILEATTYLFPMLKAFMLLLEAIAANTAKEDELKDIGQDLFDEIRDFFDSQKNNKDHAAELKLRGIGMPV